MSKKECGNCIHYNICDPYVSPKESFPEVKGGCQAFKDKSLCVELPCKVMCGGNRETFISTLQSIVFYNGHKEWLQEVVSLLKECMQEDKYLSCLLNPDEWYTEKHMIWEILVGLFGDWGTSIRSGWIEDWQDCIDFINVLCEVGE